jgi:membrane protein
MVSASSGLVGVAVQRALLLDGTDFPEWPGGMAALLPLYCPTPMSGYLYRRPVRLAELKSAKSLRRLRVAVPTYSMVYGAFAALPILLSVDLYAWVIVLMGTVISAYLPSPASGRRHAPLRQCPWQQFQLAIEIRKCWTKLPRITARMGVSASQLAEITGWMSLRIQAG